MEEKAYKPHPALSYGNHMDDESIVVIRVDEDSFKGTVFCYVNVDVKDEQLEYECDFMSFVYNSVEQETPSELILQKFYETVASPFLSNTMIAAAEQEQASN